VERILIAGCGYVGGRLAELLVEDGYEVFGLRRHPGGLPAGVRPVVADVTRPGSLESLPDAVDAVVYAVSPAGGSPGEYRAAYVDGVRNVLGAVGGGRPVGRGVLVSSTGVYGYRDGRRVDEETPPAPSTATGEVILEGEHEVVERSEVGIVLRLGGIYGPGRDRTVRRVRAGEADCPAVGVYGNRIHRDDAARAIRHLLTLPDPDPLYLGVDRDPAELRDVYRWVAGRAGVPDPCQGTSAGDDAGPAGRRGTNKRCSSDRLAATGFRWLYPTFREGYATLM
jgi:nucleoside-diphosphate-sugar epimerase